MPIGGMVLILALATVKLTGRDSLCLLIGVLVRGQDPMVTTQQDTWSVVCKMDVLGV